MEQSCVGRNPALATGLRTRRGSGCSDAGQVARPGGGFYAGQVARQWSAMKNDENFNISIRHVEAIRFQGQQGGRPRLLCRAEVARQGGGSNSAECQTATV